MAFGWAASGMPVDAGLHALLEPGPQTADFLGGRAGRVELRDALPDPDRVLVVVAHDDVHVRQDAEHGEAVGGVADAVAARRRLVQDEGELLLQPVDRGERRLEGAQVRRSRPARDDAEIGGADRGQGAGAVDARRVDEDVVVGRLRSCSMMPSS